MYDFQITYMTTVYLCSENLSNLRQKTLKKIPTQITYAHSLNSFKESIKMKTRQSIRQWSQFFLGLHFVRIVLTLLHVLYVGMVL